MEEEHALLVRWVTRPLMAASARHTVRWMSPCQAHACCQALRAQMGLAAKSHRCSRQGACTGFDSAGSQNHLLQFESWLIERTAA